MSKNIINTIGFQGGSGIITIKLKLLFFKWKLFLCRMSNCDEIDGILLCEFYWKNIGTLLQSTLLLQRTCPACAINHADHLNGLSAEFRCKAASFFHYIIFRSILIGYLDACHRNYDERDWNVSRGFYIASCDFRAENDPPFQMWLNWCISLV